MVVSFPSHDSLLFKELRRTFCCFFSLVLFCLTAPCGKRDLSSLTRDWTHNPCRESTRVLTTGLTGKVLSYTFKTLKRSSINPYYLPGLISSYFFQTHSLIQLQYSALHIHLALTWSPILLKNSSSYKILFIREITTLIKRYEQK